MMNRMVSNYRLSYRTLYVVEHGFSVNIASLIQQVPFVKEFHVDSENMFPVFVLDVGSSKVMFDGFSPYYCNHVCISSWCLL